MTMMRKSALAAVAAVLVLGAAGGASAQLRPADPGPVMVAPNAFDILAPKVDCGIYVEVHVTLQNKGAATLPAGTVIHWVLSSGQSGGFVLPVALVPGDAILVENALAAPVRGRVACTATVVARAAP
ncbi:MAG: hypothetical protein KIS96_10685 [Bauldia sp.]|nr:hypothetical protein [Bauldia sp.]